MMSTAQQTHEIDIAKIAVESCKRVRPQNTQQAVQTARRMLAVEKTMGVPKQFQGMSLAAACLESGFNANAKGDKRGKRYDRGRYRALPYSAGLSCAHPAWPRGNAKVLPAPGS